MFCGNADMAMDMTEEELYVTGIAMSQFVFGATRLGIDAQPYLERAGFDADIDLRPMSRVPCHKYEKVILDMALDSGDELFGMHIGEQVMLPMYSMLVSLLLSSASLLDGLKSAAMFQSLVSGNVGGFQIREDDEQVIMTLSMAHQNPILRRHLTECVITLLGGVLRSVIGHQELAAEEVCFGHEPYSAHTRAVLEKMANGPVRWGTASTYIVMNKRGASLPLRSASSDAKQMFEEHARRQLEELSKRDTLVTQIQWELKELIASGIPRRATVAQRLNISERTLDRRLASVGVTWQELLDNFRSQLAREYLRDPAMVIATIAERLGFVDIRSFQRRFKVWTGMSPSEYRRDMLGKDD